MSKEKQIKKVSGVRYLGGKGSKVKFVVQMFDKGVPKIEKIGRIIEFNEPAKIVELDKDGKEGKTFTVPLQDVIEYLDPPQSLPLAE